MSTRPESIICCEPLSQDEIALPGNDTHLPPIPIGGHIFHIPQGNRLMQSHQYLEIRREALTLEWRRLFSGTVEDSFEMTKKDKICQNLRTFRARCTEANENIRLLTLPKGGKLYEGC